MKRSVDEVLLPGELLKTSLIIIKHLYVTRWLLLQLVLVESNTIFCKLTLNPFTSASLPLSTRETKNPLPNSLPPRIANPNDALLSGPRSTLLELGLTNRMTRIRGDIAPPPREERTSLEELVDP